jgi:membrane protease YdiL (CAAX protease family)
MNPEINAEKKTGRARRFVQFPLVRIIIGLVFVLGSVILGQVIVHKVVRTFITSEKLPLPWAIVMYFLMTVLAILAYYLFVRWVERRPLTELSRPGAWREFGLGWGIGFALMSLVTIVLWLLGFYQVSALGAVLVLLRPFFDSLFAGIFEEIAFRGIIFRIMNESLGSWLAILISALIFGFAHSANPNASLFNSIAIAVEAGILLSTAYLFTRRLWMVIGIHFAWNFTLGGIYGIPVSGREFEGLFKSSLEGPALLTGGEFGAEASIFAVIICLLAGLFFLWKARQRGHFTSPFWVRSKESN